MAHVIKLGYSNTNGASPNGLAGGEVAINTHPSTRKIWVGNGSGNQLVFNHADYAASGHNHDSAYAPIAHNASQTWVNNNFNNYSHPTGAGNKHIPTGGSSGQFLKYSSSGTAVWAADNNTTYTLASLGFTGATNANYFTYTHPTGAGNKHVPTGGSSGQFLKYSSSGTATWATPSYTTNTNTWRGISNSVTTVDAATSASSTAVKQAYDRSWPNTHRTVEAGGNTLASSETLEFKAGTNMAIAESGGEVTFTSTDTNTNTWRALGGNSDQAMRGDHGTSAYNHSIAAHAPSNANNYSHPTGAGNNHVPTGGSSGQFLKYSSSGVATWATPSYTSLSGYATTSYVTTQVNNLIASAPGALDTLNELAAAIGDDANYATTVTNALAGKLGSTAKAADSNLLDGVDSAVYLKSPSNVSGWTASNRNFSIRTGGAATGLHMEESDGTFGFQLYGDSGSYGFLDGEWAAWDIKKAASGNFEVDEGSGLKRVWNAGNVSAGTGISISGNTVTCTVTNTNTWRGISNAVDTVDAATSASLTAVKSAYDRAWPNTWRDLGTSSSTAYRGDHGLIAYNHSQASHAPSNANNYSHPTGAGNNHVPSGGSSGNFLKYSSSGVATWATPSYTTNTNTWRGISNAVDTVDAGTSASLTAVKTAYDRSWPNTWRGLGGTSSVGHRGDHGEAAYNHSISAHAPSNANNYSHPTGNGNNHIPSGGSSGNFLKYSSAGVATWATPSYTSDTNTWRGLGGTSSVGHRGDHGEAAYNHSISSHAPSNANNYSHPTGNGNNHVPSGGSSGQFLKYSSAGVATWATPSYTTNTDTWRNLGSTSSTAMRGDHGTSAYNHSIAAHAPSNANNYSHPTGAGNNHIPSGGAADKFLKWSSSGVATWEYDNQGVFSISCGWGLTGGTINAIGTVAHSSANGFKHIPSDGSSGQFLGYSSAGTAAWVGNPNTDTNTWRGISNSVSTVDAATSASLTAVKSAYDRSWPNTTYTASTGLYMSGTDVRHSDTSSQASSNNSGTTFIQDITLDGYGHVTAIGTGTASGGGTTTWNGLENMSALSYLP